MASANFQAFDRTLRRIHMLNLVEALARKDGSGFRASIVVNPRTGLPVDVNASSNSPRNAGKAGAFTTG